MTSKHESWATRQARRELHELQPFYGTILDVAFADKKQVELFAAVGRTRGPFTRVIDWPYLNGLIEDQSRRLLATEGEEAWKAAGGSYGDDGKPTFIAQSSHAAQIVQAMVGEPGGFIWTDKYGDGWAVSLVPSREPHAYAGLAISWSGGGRVIDPVAREEYRRAVEQQIADLDSNSEAAIRHELQQIANRMWLYRHAEQLLWTVHQAVLIQRSSVVVLPDLALGQVVWGGDRNTWPKNWRNSLMEILSSLTKLHVAAIRICGTTWRPRFTMRSVAVAYCEIIERMPGRTSACTSACPLWNKPEPHQHFQIQIGYGFLGLLEHFKISDDRQGERRFDFEQKKLEGDAGERIKEAIGSGQLVPVHLPTRVFGRLDQRLTGIINALVREVTRVRAKNKSSRPDKADVLTGNMVRDVRGRTLIVCPLLRRDGRYVSFNGNGKRRGMGYLIAGTGSSGWLARCGYVRAVDADAKWTGRDGLGHSTREFLDDLAELGRQLGLIAVGLARTTGEWLDLKRMMEIANLPGGMGAVDEVHLRIYGPEDYLERCRNLVAEMGQFTSINGGDVGEAAESGPLMGDANIDLRVRLQRAGLSQEDLARHLGVSKSFISKVLNGKKAWPEGMRERVEAFVPGNVRTR